MFGGFGGSEPDPSFNDDNEMLGDRGFGAFGMMPPQNSVFGGGP